MAEGSGYGMVYTSDSAKKHLLENNRDYNNRLTWQNLFNDNALSAQRAENKLVQQYTDASAAAYVAYMQNQNAIRNSGIVGVGKQALLEENNQALVDAYNSYRSNLQEGTTAIQNAALEQEEAINTSLEEQADYTAEYANAHYGYLTELYNRYEKGENTLFDEGSQWYKYTTAEPMTGEEDNVMLDDEGNIIYDARRLKTWDELVNTAYDEVQNADGTITKEYSSLYDENGNLTLAGVDFFDQLENQIATEGGYSWGDYLNETNPELATWADSYNPYNYTIEGTNAGTMRTMFGMMSTDYAYEFAERMGGLTSKQLDETYSKFTEFSNELATKLESANGKLGDNDIHKSIQESTTEMTELMNEFGISDELNEDLQKAYGITLEDLTNAIQEYVNQSYSKGDIDAMAHGSGAATGTTVGAPSAVGGAVIAGGAAALVPTIVGAAGGSIAGAAGGAAVGAVAGPIGAVIGAVVGVIAGVIAGAVQTSKIKDSMKESNYNVATNMQSSYNNLLSALTNYSAYKKREVEINFANQNIY